MENKISVLIRVGLIIVILAISGIVYAVKGNSTAKDAEDIQSLQESIMGYTDGQTENMQDLLQIGDLQQTANPQKEDLAENAAKIPEATIKPETDKLYQGITFEPSGELAEMMAYWKDNNQKALDDLAFLGRFKAMSYSLIGTDEFYYYGETNSDGKPDGLGIAVYAENKYYYGTWTDGKRWGRGTFLHYHIHEGSNVDAYSYHFYTGDWKNDLPDGEGSEHFEFNRHNMEAGVGYNSNVIGNFKEGFYDGNLYITNLFNNGNVKEWAEPVNEGVLCMNASKTVR